MGTLELALLPIDPIVCLDMYSIWDDLLPSDEVFLEYLIQSNLFMDVDSIVAKSNPDLLSEYDPSTGRYSYVYIVESLGSPIEQQVSDPDEFDPSCRIFDSCDVKSVPVDPINCVNFSFPLKVDIID